ncbi:uncharacterized protein TNCV_2846921 [Trichonephila clavipes]|nr:uncharacterized protein TNCV_2846921 [Trichonephila clavipes]
MDVCKCIVPLRHGSTLNSRQALSPLMWFVEGEEKWKAPDHPQGFLPLNWGGTEQSHTVTCMVIKAKANDRRKNSAISRDEFRGSRSDFIRELKRLTEIKNINMTTKPYPNTVRTQTTIKIQKVGSLILEGTTQRFVVSKLGMSSRTDFVVVVVVCMINSLNINVTLFSYSRAFGDGPRNFEPWSRDVDDTSAGTSSPNSHTISTGGRFSSRQI